MLSNGNNVETIAQLIEELKHHVELQAEFLKFDVIDRAVRLVTAIVSCVVAFILVIAILFYLSFSLVYWLEPVYGTSCAFAIVAGIFFVLMLLFFLFRKVLVERPLVKFLAKLLLK